MTEPRIIKTGVLLTSGPYAGWKAIGPYIKAEEGRPDRLYYRIKKNGQQRSIPAEKMTAILGLASTQDKKPFL